MQLSSIMGLKSLITTVALSTTVAFAVAPAEASTLVTYQGVPYDVDFVFDSYNNVDVAFFGSDFDPMVQRVTLFETVR